MSDGPDPAQGEGREPGGAGAAGAAPPAAAAGAPPQPGPEEAEAALRAFEQAEQQSQAALPGEEEARPAGLPLPDGAARPGPWRRLLAIRDEPSLWGRAMLSLLVVVLILLAWYLATRPWWGPGGEERAIDRLALGSPEEVFGSFASLWFDRALMRNLLASLWRVLQGFGLAVAVGVPLGILCGAFPRVDALFAPLSLFGRNVPIAALVPLTMLFFGIGEGQKVAFIFIACVAFVVFDASRAIMAISDAYLDTAYTLGANRRQILTKVLIPLAMPDIFNSIRLLFGLAFGYIILAEIVNAEFGLGKLILTSQRRGPQEHVYLILLFLTLVAYLLDRGLYAMQRLLFPYRYGRS